MTRDAGRDLFYFPGGMREPGESDNETLVREIEEELQAVIVAGTLVHFGTFETRSDHGGGKLP
ncbi:NUDIX domain-containing protein [Streptomyces phaeochromogenes]|uniref:NUDIX domain-containing protein n=1 Tax=Streptomyces phaeochromogenes TaxID=1923 RepID=UPI000AD6216C